MLKGARLVEDTVDQSTQSFELTPDERRVLGVLIEKGLSTPEYYPMTLKALIAGCNQKSNRDPHMALEDFQLSGALQAMIEKALVLRVSVSGSRTVRFKHLCEEKLGLNGREKAVLAELLVRGPQAPGALKARVARMGMAASPAEILVVLEGLRARVEGPLVEQMPQQPRERDQRWQYLLGGRAAADATVAPATAPEMPLRRLDPPAAAPEPAAVLVPTKPAEPEPEAEAEGLAARVAGLERRVAELEGEIARLRDR